MKLIESCLKSKGCIQLELSDHDDSDISEGENRYEVPKFKPISSKFKPVRSLSKKPPLKVSTRHPRKVQCVCLESESEQCYQPESAPAKGEHKKQAHPMKSRLIKASNKYKLQGKDFSSTQCSICLTSLENKPEEEIGKLPCNHAFCVDCIIESSKFCNKCPYCRSTFKEIDNGLRFIAVEERNYEDNMDFFEDEPCYICGRNDDFDHLLQCQFCEAAFCHTYCDTRLNSSAPPEGNWYCLSCSQIMQ